MKLLNQIRSLTTPALERAVAVVNGAPTYTVEDIHKAFYTEGERIIEEAKRILLLSDPEKVLLEKANRLSKLGFHQSKEQVKVAAIRQTQAERETQKNLAYAIEAYMVKYPIYKVIPKASLDELCKKYGLIWGGVSNYTGSIPDVNLKRIEEFKLKHEDICTKVIDHGRYSGRSSIIYRAGDWSRQRHSTFGESYEHAGLVIAAPHTDFNKAGMQVEGDQLIHQKVQDPVVMQPLVSSGQTFFLIITAWGPEASDPIVVNQRDN